MKRGVGLEAWSYLSQVLLLFFQREIVLHRRYLEGKYIEDCLAPTLFDEFLKSLQISLDA